ncbi:hypothetical protein EYC87_18275 [Halieaceae bacterium IMCC8485]|uniref:Uncharacterized protein n=1 Tax=Candidatus Seongchinamella marina TaxID=2518990 RepID=A0ABT3SZV1_9GAMM|nr:DUF6776 family protein [Candidatus Seongchinamella marina]MCX2975531.1 hypothetical protein [Candidatus Seongchinamella marina]
MPITRKRHLSSQEMRRLWRQRLLLAVLILLGFMVAAFYIGERAAYSGMGLNPELYRAMKTQLPELQAQLVVAEARLEVQSTQNQMGQQALEMVRRDLADQKEQIASLEEGLQFYRSLMAPGEIAQGLSLRPLELVALDNPGYYSYRIVAQQEARKHSQLKGELSAEVIGVLAGQQVSYSLAELSSDIEGSEIALRFRYFQSIDGELSLPEGFEPRSVSLVATATAPRKMEVREQYPWQVTEKFTHVGK